MPAKVAMKTDGPVKPPKPSRLRKWLIRLGLGLVGLIVLFVGLVAASIWIDRAIGRGADAYTNVTFTADDGTELVAYLAEPEEMLKDTPAIIMFHEWWGLNRDITTLADALASEGYVVLAPDAYRGETTRWIPSALWLVTQTDEDQIASDMDNAFEYLTGLDNVDTENIGTVGFCFGGRQSFNMAQRQQTDVDAVVSLYGTAYTRARDLDGFNADVPLLGIYGEDDNSISADDVRTMDELMDDAGLDHEVLIYEGVGHAFVTDENYDEPGAASEAWGEIVGFFDEHLKSAESNIRTLPLARSPFESTPIAQATPQFMCLLSH